MRIAALTLAFAACSSPAAKPSTPKDPKPARTTEPSPLESSPVEPTDPPVASLSVEPVEPSADPAPPCLPRGSEPWYGAEGVIIACDFDYEPRECQEVSPDGTVTPVPEPPKPRHANVSGRLVEICPGGDAACDVFEPEKKTDEVPFMADMDLAGTRATVVRQVRGASSAVVEVWDPTKEKRLAHKTFEGGTHFYAWLLGKTILVGVGADDSTEYTLWTLVGSKLKRLAKLDREPFVWVVLDDRTVAMRWHDGGVDILDARTGKVTHAVAWEALVPDATQVAGVFLAELGDRTFAVAPHDADRHLLGIGIGDADGTVTPYPVTLCP